LVVSLVSAKKIHPVSEETRIPKIEKRSTLQHRKSLQHTLKQRRIHIGRRRVLARFFSEEGEKTAAPTILTGWRLSMTN